jgi:hypothetical protein
METYAKFGNLMINAFLLFINLHFDAIICMLNNFCYLYRNTPKLTYNQLYTSVLPEPQFPYFRLFHKRLLISFFSFANDMPQTR